MAQNYFEVKNGLKVGSLLINASNGSVTSTSINPSTDLTGNLTVSSGSANAIALISSFGLTNAVSTMVGNANSFIQSALINNSNSYSSSTDFIAYNVGGDNTSGFIDMGMTSPAYNDPQYGITRGNEGYLFCSAADGYPGSGNLVIATDSTGTHNSIIFAAGGFIDGTVQAQIVKDEGLQVKGNISSTNGAIYQGTNANRLIDDNYVYAGSMGLTNASGVFVGNANDFVQFALKNLNTGSSASTDMIVYTSNGDNDSGFMDMGITSATYSNPTFGITGKDDGYIFMSAPSGTTGNGSVIIATDSTGQHNDIVFSSNGFVAGKERMRIIGQDRVGKPAGVEIYISTQSTSTSTGALRVQGGIGCQGNVNIAGNLTIQGNVFFSGGGTQLAADNLSITNPMIFVGNANTGDSYTLGIVDIKKIGGVNQYGGLVRDYSTGWYNLFANLRTLPTTSIDLTSATLQFPKLKLGEILIANTTTSTSTSTGALIVNGGAGIAGTLYVGGLTTHAGNIVPSANLTYNVGSTTTWFNNVYANAFYGTATYAKYADLAECYSSDADYAPGTVLDFGGEYEVTVSNKDASPFIAGVVSTNPAHLMNSNMDAEHIVAVALTGRVPVKVAGPVCKGQMMVSAGNGFARAETTPVMGSVIGKALENNIDGEGIIEVVVGRL